eukprot:COSAG02_NODE_8812_length_2435_cov_3.939212_2_plen_203_part_00
MHAGRWARRHAGTQARKVDMQTDSQAVIIVLDNCGLELLADLVLADGLLGCGAAAHVVLHCKAQPVFVSDAMAKDIAQAVEWIGTRGTEACVGIATRLAAAQADGRLVISPQRFYTTASPWYLPASICLTILQYFTCADIKRGRVQVGDASALAARSPSKPVRGTTFGGLQCTILCTNYHQRRCKLPPTAWRSEMGSACSIF